MELRSEICIEVFPGGSGVKNVPANAGDTSPIPEQDDSLEKKMATHSSTLVWEIQSTEEPGGLQPMGFKRVGHDRAAEQQEQKDAEVNRIKNSK